MPNNLREMNEEEVKSDTNVQFNNMYSTSFDSMKKTNDSEDVTDTSKENEENFEMVSKSATEPYTIVVSDSESVIPPQVREEIPDDKIKENLKKLDNISYDSLVEYGADIQKTMSDKSEEIMKVTQHSDNPKSIQRDLKGIMDIFEKSDPKELFPEEQNLWQRIKNRGKKSIEEIFAQFNDDSAKLKNIEVRLNRGQNELNRDIQYMEKLKGIIVDNYMDTFTYIAALEQKRHQIANEELPLLESRIQSESNNLELSSQYYNYKDAIDQIDKKIHSLQSSQMLSYQTHEQLNMMQNMNKNLSLNIKDQVVTVIPQWRNQINMAYTAHRQNAYAKLNEMIASHTDDMIRANSDVINETAMKIAAASERSYVDIDTIKEVQNNIKDTVNTITEIKKLGKEKRLEESEEMKELIAQQDKFLSELHQLKESEFDRDQ